MDATNNQNVTDDQELAKVLEGMNQDMGGVPPVPTAPTDDTTDPAAADPALSFEETQPAPETPAAPVEEPVAPAPVEPVVAPVEPITPVEPVIAMPTTTASPELDSIKKSALEELRPLVDKLDLPADEKFDTLLLLIRSTDDKSLVSAAHEAAKAIPDETKRAQALLDVIKEIDYFSGQGQNPA